ncbi:hypothetical protein AAULR_25856, partial [Lacticaseibacillus rhamnosus MTCC 5462]
MAEREDAGVAEQQVEGAGEEGEAQHLHQEDRVEVERRHGQGGHADQDQHGFQAQQRTFGGRGDAQLAVHQASLPIRPAGRTSSTIAMITKI